MKPTTFTYAIPLVVRLSLPDLNWHVIAVHSHVCKEEDQMLATTSKSTQQRSQSTASHDDRQAPPLPGVAQSNSGA